MKKLIAFLAIAALAAVAIHASTLLEDGPRGVSVEVNPTNGVLISPTLPGVLTPANLWASNSAAIAEAVAGATPTSLSTTGTVSAGVLVVTGAATNGSLTVTGATRLGSSVVFNGATPITTNFYSTNAYQLFITNGVLFKITP